MAPIGATIDMFGEALRDCPDQLWGERLWVEKEMDADSAAFWYVSYHTLFWLVLDLSGGEGGFALPEPFTLVELDPAGVLPPRMYTRDELLSSLVYCRRKCQETIGTLTTERAYRLCQFGWGECLLWSGCYIVYGTCRSMVHSCACSSGKEPADLLRYVAQANKTFLNSAQESRWRYFIRCTPQVFTLAAWRAFSNPGKAFSTI